MNPHEMLLKLEGDLEWVTILLLQISSFKYDKPTTQRVMVRFFRESAKNLYKSWVIYCSEQSHILIRQQLSIFFYNVLNEQLTDFTVLLDAVL